VTTGYNMVWDPYDDKHVFMANTDIGLMESRDGGASWSSATDNNGVPDAWQNTTYWITFDPAVKGKAWAVMSGNHDLPRPKMWRKNGIANYKGGVLMTEDGGRSWRPISADIGEAAVTHILMDPSSSPASQTLYVCAFGKGVYKSVDGGKSWQRKNKGIAGMEPFAWRITRNGQDGTLYLIVSRRCEDSSTGPDKGGALYRSADGAESWTRVPLPAGTNGPTCLLTDPEQAGRLLLSAWGSPASGRFTPDTGGGIWLSVDGGKTWEHVLSADQHIHDLSFDPRIKRWYACGFEGAAWLSDDRGLTWSRIKGYDFKWGKRVEPDPADPRMIYIITYGGGVWHGPAEAADRDSDETVNGLKRN
jgi:photosystem II stability/assembly factor-like uncharacterized protein